MTPVITLFCEGTKDSLDYRVLEKLLNPSLNRLVPSGGKHGLSAFMEGYNAVSRVTNKDYFRAFRDRDFDYEVPQNPSIIRDGKFIVAYRTMIENYLLHPRTLFDYIQMSGSPKLRSRVAILSDSEDIFRDAISKLRFYTAARWAHGVTKRQKAQLFSIQSNWPQHSGNLPENIGDTDCRVIMSDILGNIKDKATQLNLHIFEQNYSDFVLKFDGSFLQDFEQCLIWFNGKDLATMLYRLLGGSNFFQNGSRGDYYDFALDPSRFRIEEYADLVELRGILNGTIPL